jgi:predicted nucleotidyltransferase
MKDITKTEIRIVLTLVKSPEVYYNANNLSKAIDISSMGALKILKKLEKESVLTSKKIGQANIYRLNATSIYASRYTLMILARESIYADPNVKRWVAELKKIKNAEMIILFGSVLNNSTPKDIDILFLTNQENFRGLKKEIEEINELNVKKIHPMYQTFEDLVKNIKKRDAPLLNAIKGIIVYGEEKFIELYNESRKE